MSRITISGGFHNTSEFAINVKLKNGRPSLSYGQAKRIRDTLCGVRGCCCGITKNIVVDGVDKSELMAAIFDAETTETWKCLNRK